MSYLLRQLDREVVDIAATAWSMIYGECTHLLRQLGGAAMGQLLRIGHHTGIEGPIELATEAFLATSDFTNTTRRVYRRTLIALADDLEQGIRVHEISQAEIRQHLKYRYGTATPATYNRNLATLRSFFDWCIDYERTDKNPATNIKNRKKRRSTAAERQARPISYEELDALWSDDTHDRRDRCYWAMLYDTAARANELLLINIEDLDLANKEAIVIGKGGNAEHVNWSSLTARRLPSVIAKRTKGPLFIANRRPVRAPADDDLCPTTSRARLSYRRAAELFKNATAQPDGSHHTLHQLRHSRLTHLAAEGESAPMLKAKSRHTSLRSLEPYVNPSRQDVRDMTNRHDPNRRRR